MIDTLRSLVLAFAVIGLLSGCSSRIASPFPKTSVVSSSSRTVAMSGEIERLNALVEREQDPLRKSRHLVLLGSMYIESDDLSAAWDAHEQARLLRVEAGDDELILESSHFLASLLAAGNRHEQALELLELDLARPGLSVDAREDPRLNQLLAMLYFDSRQFKKAARSARTAAEGFSGRNLREEEAKAKYHEAKALWELKERERAAKLLRESFDYFHGYAAAYDSARHREMARIQRITARKWRVNTREWGSE